MPRPYRIHVPLTPETRKALARAATVDHRDSSHEAAALVEEGLRVRGFLNTDRAQVAALGEKAAP